MFQTEEQILIVYSLKGTPKVNIDEAEAAISSYSRSGALVMSVITKPLVFQIPTGSSPGATLGTDLTKELQNSIGAIVFLDDLRPNIAYELGFFHGQGKTVLLVTDKRVEQIWKTISDLSGCALLSLKSASLSQGIHAYLDGVYDKLAAMRLYPVLELPIKSRNMVKGLVAHARIPVNTYDGDFGETIRVDTWGGIVFEVGYNLLPEAKFKIAIRGESPDSSYSIYFRVRFPDPLGVRRTIWLGLTSNRGIAGFEGHERNLPSQSLTRNWQLLVGSFSELLKTAQILGVPRVEYLELIRVRAGEYQSDPFAKNPAFELGYFELVGIDQ
jgi:hypothetical protein